jgi:hypothetical protein
VRSIPVPDPSGLHGIGKSARPFRFHDHRITIAEEFSTSKRCDDTTVRPWPAASRSSCRPRRVPSVRNRLGCSSQVLGDKKDTKRARAGGGTTTRTANLQGAASNGLKILLARATWSQG